MSFNKDLAKAIKAEYDFNEYEIAQDKLIEVTKIIEYLSNKRTHLQGKFIQDLHSGKLGMWYRQPVSILSLASKYFENCPKENTVQNPYDLYNG